MKLVVAGCLSRNSEARLSVFLATVTYVMLCSITIDPVLMIRQIGRESARLASAFGATILAANTTGEKTPQEGYRIPGTGDPDGR